MPKHTVGSIKLVGDVWYVSAAPHVMLRVQRWWPHAIAPKAGSVQTKNTDEVCKDLLMLVGRWSFEIPPRDRSRIESTAQAYDERTERFHKLMAEGKPDEVFQLALPPREYQAVAAQLWLQQRSLLVADELGLGKTIVGLAALSRPEMRPAVICCPLHLAEQWRREALKFLPQVFPHVIKTRTYYPMADSRMLRADREAWLQRQEELGHPRPENAGEIRPSLLILPYSRASGWGYRLSGQAKAVVFDEVQELRGKDSDKYKACREFGATAEARLGLSATPISNLGGEIFHVMSQVAPDALGALDEFNRLWCRSLGQGKFALNDPHGFGRYLREAGLMVRRTRKDVGRELPKLTTILHPVEADTRALLDVAPKAAELAKLLLAPSTDFATRGTAARELDWRLRQATGLAKATYVAALVRLLVDDGQKVLLSGWHRAVYTVWMEALADLNPVMYTGSENAKQKQFAIDKFVNDEACRVFIISLRSGAGINGLQQVCSTVVHGELDWTFAAHEQLTGRLDRDGQTRGVFEYFPICDDGSDPTVADTIGLKRGQLDGIRDPDAPVLQKVEADPNHLKALAANYLGKKR